MEDNEEKRSTVKQKPIREGSSVARGRRKGRGRAGKRGIPCGQE